MRLLVVGAGSTGGYFGARLAQAGRDVTFLVRSARAAQLRTTGLQIVSPHGDITLSPQLVSVGGPSEAYDLILLAVKAYSLDAALHDAAPAVGPHTMILPVLNGMKHMEVLRARFGPRAVMGCTCIITSRMDEQGRVVQMTPPQSLAYGELDGSLSARARALDSFMQGAGFDARLSPTIEREMWEKWILLSSLGGMTCLMRGTIGEIVAAPGGLPFAHQFLDEVLAAVRAVGPSPSEPFVSAARAFLTAPGSGQTSSMYRDMQDGGRVEADQILGDLLHRAQQRNVITPLLAAAYANLHIYQHRLASSRP